MKLKHAVSAGFCRLISERDGAILSMPAPASHCIPKLSRCILDLQMRRHSMVSRLTLTLTLDPRLREAGAVADIHCRVNLLEQRDEDADEIEADRDGVDDAIVRQRVPARVRRGVHEVRTEGRRVLLEPPAMPRQCSTVTCTRRLRRRLSSDGSQPGVLTSHDECLHVSA